MIANALSTPRNSPVPGSSAIAGWALLIMDGLTIAVAQKDIVTIEIVSSLRPTEQDDNKIGWFVANGLDRWPVYCLNRYFATMPALAQSSRVFILMRSKDHTFGLAGTQVSLLADDADLLVTPLPVCLASPGSPLIGLALYRDGVVAVIQAETIPENILSWGTSS